MSIEREIKIENYEDEPTAGESPRKNRYRVYIPVNNACKKAQGFLEDIYNNDNEDARQDLYDLIEQFTMQGQQSGTSDDFHNFAVELAFKDEYALSCRVLECGLIVFPKNVDLLADFLQYGVNCGRLEDCEKIYHTLLNIPRRRWTWRGFAFLVDYLQFLIERSDSDEEINAKEDEMRAIVTDFRTYYPYSEDSYRTEAEVYHSLNMPDNEAEILSSALENVRVAPKCALRYADIMFERGMYEDAATAVKRAIKDATQKQSSVNEGYLYYLSALCKIAMAFNTNAETAINESVANDIYSDFNIALSKFKSIKNSYTEVIRTKTITIINKSRVMVDPSYEHLYEYVAN